MEFEKIKNGKVFIWMQLLGFNRDDPDRGANRFLNQTGFVPEGACALLFHPDFVHQHRGMDEEYELPADNCAYWGIPRNKERDRQPWTNRNLRDLAHNLKAKGSGLYAGIMGVTVGGFHDEWYKDHPEVMNGWSHFILKRFKDGSFYEDFFIDQLCKTLVDYGMRGVHFSDAFCPNGNILHGDYSVDMVEQFIAHTGFVFPDGIVDAVDNNVRKTWIWANIRADWIEFLCWRWEQFFVKCCARVHAVGCEVLALAMYCTDPFETKYCLGIDLARIMKAGVDYLTENILPTSVYVASTWANPQYYFHRYMAIAPTTAAHVKHGHLISMVGLQDASEEWDMMRHMPCLHERDLYTMMAYQVIDGKGTRRSLEGYFLCLGDGIQRNEWDIEHEKMAIALSADVESVISPAMLWSDYAYQNMLDEYIQKRRWTPFKLFYEMGKAGTMCAACITPEALADYNGTLLVPDFDMLSYEEQIAVLNYKNGAVVCTAPVGFDLAVYNIQPTIQITDRFSKHPQSAFVFGTTVSQETIDKIETLLSVDDGAEDPEPEELGDHGYTLIDTLTFTKVTIGFRDATALLLKEASGDMITCDMPYIANKLKNGAWRLYIFNTVNEHYRHAFVKINQPVTDVQIVSSFPVLPVRFIENKSGNLTHKYTEGKVNKQNFELKLQPGGVTILDVILE